jgi:hypothetical protein
MLGVVDCDVKVHERISRNETFFVFLLSRSMGRQKIERNF